MRYQQLNDIIAKVKPKHIVEIGTWNGERAEQMITEARKYQANVYYDGYDLFEDATVQTDKEELNVKNHNSHSQVSGRIRQLQDRLGGVAVILHKGNTRETLKQKRIVADLVFIDGGHSVETIKNDYFAVKDSKCIVFDDYYLPDENGKCPDLAKYGCNSIVDQLNAHTLPYDDRVSGGGFVRMAVYSR